jgi:hypothetical protein
MHFLHSTDAHIRRGLIRGKLSKVIPYTPSDKTGSTRPVVLRRNEFNYYLSNRSRRVRWTHYGRWKTAIARVAYTNHATCIDFENFRVGEKQLHRWESYHRNDSTALVCIRENEASCNEQQNNWVGRAGNVGQDRRVPLNSPRDAACWIIVGNEPEPGSHRIDLDHLKAHK